MEYEKIKIDLTLLTCVVQALGKIPETLYDFQKVKTLSCGGDLSGQKLTDSYHDPLPERLEIAEGDFSVIGKMSRLKSLKISALPIADFSFLKTCAALENLEILECGVIDCACLVHLTSLRSLSLHDCQGVINTERILKLYRLKKLSLKGDMISDVSCFLHCWIPEVHLPKENEKAEKPPVKKREKAAETEGFTGVPFRAVKREERGYQGVEGLDSPLWEIYRGAYGNVREYIEILTDEKENAPETFKLRRLETVPKTNYEIAFDNLFENLYHQMSFYQATWLVLPYLAKLMEGWEKEADSEWLFQGIMAAGSCLATDVFGDKPEEREVYDGYLDVEMRIRAITVSFLAGHIAYVREKPVFQRREFAIAVTAILGEKKLAYMFFLSGLESCYIVCPACGNCDEEIEFGYFEPSERIEAAGVPSGKWDGESLEDVKLWLFHLFALVGDSEGMERLCYYFGTYVCPECGEKTAVLKGMEEYFG